VARLPPDLLDLPAQRGVRLVTRDLLARARSASRRVGAVDDVEALHDFRVALRRLRSWVRAYRAHLGKSVPKRSRRALKVLATATNAGRDAEVQLALVKGASQGWSADRLPGVAWLTGRLEERRDQAYHRALRRVATRFQGMEQTLRSRLRRRSGDDAERFGYVTASLLQAHAAALRGRLAEITQAADEPAIHAARIAAKRLRYLLEPLKRYREEAAPLIDRLRELQDLLGELHDLHLLGAEVVTSAAPEAARSGLAALMEYVGERESALFARLRTGWLDAGASEYVAGVDLLSRGLLVAVRVPQVRERRYLLSGIPAELQATPPVETHEGWLPGTALQERLRAECGPDGERYYRCVTVGSGADRTEMAEDTTKELFEALWPLTGGKRITVRRFPVTDGSLTWEVDAFPERDLVLARVAVPLPRKRVVLPAVIRPFLVRDVTEEPEYSGVNLAR
jgi:CHAD domain-containing protein